MYLASEYQAKQVCQWNENIFTNLYDSEENFFIGSTVESGNIARSFMLRTMHSEPAWLYLWSYVSIFGTAGDSILLSTNLHVQSLQFGGNFDFNVMWKNPNISERNYEFNLCQTHRCYVSKTFLFDNIAK